MWFTRRKKPEIITPTKPTDPVVVDAKRRTHNAADAAKESADHLNEVFKQNGITLNILKAAGGHHNGN